MFMVLLLAAAAASPGLHIDPGLDSGLPCPAYSALRARLGALDPAALEANPGSLRLEVSLGWQAARSRWKLRLNRADGAAALERELQLGETDCPLVAESAALVIDRFLAALREPSGDLQAAIAAPARAPVVRKQAAPNPPAAPLAGSRPAAPSKAPRDPEPASEAAPATPPIPAAPPPATVATPRAAPIAPQSQALARPVAPTDAPARAAVEPAPAPPAPAASAAKQSAEPREAAPPPARAQLSLALGPAAIVGLPSDLRAALWLEAEHPIPLPAAEGPAAMPLALSTRFFVLGSASSSQPVVIEGSDRGAISARSILLAAAGGLCATRWLRFCASGFAGLRLISGGSGGDGIFAQGSALLAQPELGGVASVDQQLGERLSLRFSLLLGAAPGSASLSIQGGPVRQFSTADLAAGLLLGYSLF